MTTLLAVGNSESSRRCDARCHWARVIDCDCICRGRYHGKKDRALEMLQKDLLDGRWDGGVQASAQEVLGGGA